MSVLISEHRTLFIRESSRAAPNADSSPAGQRCGARIQKEDPTAPPRVFKGSRGCEIDGIWDRQPSLPFTARKGSSRNLTQEDRPGSSQSHIPSTGHRCQSKMENRAREDPSPGGVSDHLYDSYCTGLACAVGQFLETETGIETGASSIPATTSCTTAAQDGPIPTITQSSWVEDCHEDTDSSAERRLSDPYESTVSVYDNIDSAPLPTPPSPPPPISNLEDVTSHSLTISATEDPSPGGVSDHLYDSYCPGLACTVGQFLETETGIETGAFSIPATTSCTTAAQDGPIPTITQSSWVEDCHEDTDNSAERRLSDPYESTFSVYDNIDSAPLPTPLSPPPPISNLEDMTSVGSWSSSSCEILLEETSEASHCSSRTAGGGSMEPNLSSSLSLRPSSALTDNLGAGFVSSGSSEVFLATQDNNPGNSPATRCLLAGLKHQMARQKAEYEAKIKRGFCSTLRPMQWLQSELYICNVIDSVEQRNEELELEVKNLHLNLEQQRKWYNIVEIKMRNAERAKADAEKRNAMLQREMEEFFDTFGDLTSEVKKTERIVQSF
ncbi:UNVERIFIED_CONTAM: hypothetical protein FKN15_051486 [Acipenser sinensis]